MKKLIRLFLILGVAGVVLIVIAFVVMNVLQENQTLDEESRKAAPGKFIQLSDGNTHYLELGPKDGTPVLLMHGGGITGMEVWKDLYPALEKEGKHVLVYDLFGRGYSDRLEGEYTPDVMIKQMTELMDKLNFPDTFHVVSMSMGSMISMEYASKNPGHVRTMVFLDPYATGDFKPNTLLTIPVVNKLLMTFYWYPRAVENQRKEFVNQPLFENYAERLRYFMSFEGYKRTNYSTWMNTLNQRKIELLGSYPADNVLLIYGANDPYFSRGILEVYNQTYPSLSAAEIPETGHMPHYEKPVEVNPLISAFIERHDPRP